VSGGTSSTPRAVLDLRGPGRSSSYGDAPEQMGELYLPPGAGPHPVVVALHGGFWRAKYSRKHLRPLCALIARRGWAVWNLEYRRVGKGQGGGWPATFADVAAGIDALAGLDAPLDLERVVAIGHSAGGHLALWAAARPGLPAGAPGAAPQVRVRAVAALAAASNLVATRSFVDPGGAVHDLMGVTPEAAPDDRFALANPFQRLPLGIPVLLVHGVEDSTVRVQRSRDFAEAAAAAGDADVTVREVPGEHRAVVDPRCEQSLAGPDWLERFRQDA
jgi:acetyl esterase/lipase